MSRQKGEAAEQVALAHLVAQGLTPVATHYRCRFGEIDLILRDGETLVFVEVRQRTSHRFGGAAASITADKQRRIIATARHFLARQNPLPPCRFDVVLLGTGNPPTLEWLRNAFSAD
ncbi:MAG: YraN family protein [Burkholderiales bacterium]|jgi:putative endonuclease|nr:YraN family protein [Burkholderiales bacterium]